MSYLDAGYNQYFQKDLLPGVSSVTSFDNETSESGFSADQIEGGALRSATGDMIVDLTGGSVSIISESVERVRFGKISDSDGTGLQIKDKNGNVLMQITETGNFIQGASTNLKLDFDQEHILVKDNGLPRVLIGRQDGGF